ncbi:hypothetical protein CcaverHIS002_0508530 [Cutaneotrichosporon cavernicola]|nr:hypothetical protein CcaverHIS002_0508530 [Cutaneotrichosporon cavernicola]
MLSSCTSSAICTGTMAPRASEAWERWLRNRTPWANDTLTAMTASALGDPAVMALELFRDVLRDLGEDEGWTITTFASAEWMSCQLPYWRFHYVDGVQFHCRHPSPRQLRCLNRAVGYFARPFSRVRRSAARSLSRTLGLSLALRMNWKGTSGEPGPGLFSGDSDAARRGSGVVAWATGDVVDCAGKFARQGVPGPIDDNDDVARFRLALVTVTGDVFQPDDESVASISSAKCDSR